MALIGANDPRRAPLLRLHATTAYVKNDYANASQLGQEALAEARRLALPAEIAASLRLLGVGVFHQGDFAAARDYFHQSLDGYRNLNDQRGIARLLSLLGAVAVYEDDSAIALEYYQQSLSLSRAIGDISTICTNLLNLGELAGRHGDFVTAQDYYEQCMTNTEDYFRSQLLCFKATLAFEQATSDLLPIVQEGFAVALKIKAYHILLSFLAIAGRWTAPQHPIEATRLAGLVQDHFANNTVSRKSLGKLQHELEALLPAEAVAQYKAEGAAFDLETTAREWLTRIEAAL